MTSRRMVDIRLTLVFKVFGGMVFAAALAKENVQDAETDLRIFVALVYVTKTILEPPKIVKWACS